MVRGQATVPGEVLERRRFVVSKIGKERFETKWPGEHRFRAAKEQLEKKKRIEIREVRSPGGGSPQRWYRHPKVVAPTRH